VKRGCDLLILIFGVFKGAKDQKIAASFHSAAPTWVCGIGATEVAPVTAMYQEPM
jgi:hypothetical protein